MKLNNKTIWEKIKNEDFDDIENWDVSDVTDISELFYISNEEYGYGNKLNSFNRDISKWNVENLTDMSGMFIEYNKFNQNISK